MPPIRQLPPSVVNMIAAGEVIERPASVVKELMENAVDAGASRIDIAIENGGCELVRVTDDGCGIPREQLHLALASHATSKLSSADDLYRIATLGFRGEALASIASVSRLVLRSRARGSGEGSQLEVVGGEPSPVVPCGCPEGTTIEVRNLFFNTPVRRKFLRTVQTETSHATEAFTRIALAQPAIGCGLAHNGRPLWELEPTTDWRQRIARFFGQDLADALIGVDAQDGAIRLSGYVANPSHSRSHQKMQYLFLNCRAIRDRSLQHALSEAYRGLLLTGRYPICFLRIDMPAESIDVNVHPTKAEVRFEDSGRIYRHLLAALRHRFLTSDLTARYDASRPGDLAGPHRTAETGAFLSPATAAAAAEHGAFAPPTHAFGGHGGDTLADWAAAQVAPRPADVSASPPMADPSPPLPAFPAVASGSPPADTVFSEPVHSPQRPPDRPEGSPIRAVQIHNRYLVAESQEGVIVFDQHALHERILYEQLRSRLAGGPLERQKLLVPQPVDLTPPEASMALEHRQLLAELGLDIQPFGGNTVVVSAYPAILSRIDPSDALRDLIAQLLAGSAAPDRRHLLESLLQRMACRSAVKAGDRLAPEEIRSLLEQRHLAADSHHCPHGRPTSLVLTREDLDRQFKRI